ncbi:MAG: serine/threonine protein kinase [Planctomycetales bacterium]|nr:serine/threonine protein kinase [Planctomycetales bacterium]
MADEMDKTLVTDNAQTAPEADAKSETASKPKEQTREDKGKVKQLGDFKLIKKLGQGGMGEVYLARQLSLDRDVALKILSKQLSSKKTFVDRFYREARTMAKLDHPNIVRGYAVAEDQGFHFIALELIEGPKEGRSLQDWLDKLGKLPLGDALHVMIRAADALQHAHELNLIHRDIKPDNILVTSKGVIKVSDLGLAKQTDEDMSMTQSGTGLGTPYYMPPEQARDAKHVDRRSDIYALGCTFYHFVTGQLPFKADSTLELILAKEKGQYPRARKLNPEIPERLDLIIDKMLAKDPQYRYQTCTDLIKDLEALNLANPVLGFLGGDVASAPAAASLQKTRPAASSSVQTAAGKSGPTGAAKAPSGGTEPPAGGANEEQTWYIKHSNAQGKQIVSKLPTSKVQMLLKVGGLDMKATACKSATGQFMPLAAYREFETLVQARLVKQSAEKTGNKFSKVYAEIDKADRRRKRWRWLGRWTENTVGFVGFIIYLVVIAAVIYGAYFAYTNYGKPLIDSYMKKPQPAVGTGGQAPDQGQTVPANN